MDTTRRNLLTTGAAVAAATAAPRAFAQQKGDAAMPFYQKGNVRIRYQDIGSGFPVLIIPGGGQNSTIAWGAKSAPFNSTEEFKNEYRCITADLRNASAGGSSRKAMRLSAPSASPAARARAAAVMRESMVQGYSAVYQFTISRRVLPGPFLAVRQAVGIPKGRGEAGRLYLRNFVEDIKASGLVARAIENAGGGDVFVAPPSQF